MPMNVPSHLEDRSAPLRRCRTCGETKPWTTEHFERRTERRKDGTVAERSWQLDCRPCRLAALAQRRTAAAARRKAGLAATPPVAKALGTLALPKLARPSLRTILQQAVEPEWPKIAKHMAKQAAGGDKTMIKLVTAYMLGTPREAADDNGPTEFWHALLAHASTRDPDADGDPEAAGDEPESEPFAD